MYYYLDMEDQIKLLLKKKRLPIKFNAINNDKSTIDDMSDGNIYKRFRSSVNNCCKTYSFTLSTDGISLCDKSSLSIWPVFLAINEIPIAERYFWENIIIAGNYFSLILS